MAAPEPPRPEERVLVLAPRGKNASLIHQVLNSAGFSSTHCENVRDVCSRDSLDDVGVLMVAEEAFTRSGLDDLVAALARQPAWSEVPVLVLTGSGKTTKGSAHIALALGARDNVTLLERPVRMLTLVSAVRTAMRTRRRQYEIRDLLAREHGARAQAEAANNAKDHFLAALSHELRTPLTPVLMSVAALSADPRLPEDVRSELEMVKHNVELESKLIDDLLDITRIARGKLMLSPENVDIHALLERAIKDCCQSDLRNKGLELVSELSADSHHVHGDAARLSQIFWNLIKNAIKFTPARGLVTVSTRNDHGNLMVTVADNGIGIEPESVGRIFDAFEQEDRDITRRFGGLGLGLAICKALVELHGGTICVTSAGKGQGAEFTVTLASVPAATRPAGAPVREARTIDGHPIRVLLVEDHEMTARVAARLLRAMSYDVETAGNVASALHLADAQPFDVIISDLGLPDGSGLELIRQVRARHAIPAIAMSGYGMDSDIRQSREAGFDEHLVKPLDSSKLQSAIQRVVINAKATALH